MSPLRAGATAGLPSSAEERHPSGNFASHTPIPHTMSNEQLFSKQAAEYAKFRPRYPNELFEFLVSLVQEKNAAWDCGTGNGQVALSLADRFETVHATDVNPSQIQHAFPHPRITYRVGRAENSELPAISIDLVTVGNALHWFEVDLFYDEVKRVLKPDGIIAVFQLGFQKLGQPIDEILLAFELEFLKNYWADRNRIAMYGYGPLGFPFNRLPTPSLQQSLEWDFDQLRGFVSSWSAVQKYKDQHGVDPFDEIKTPLLEVWGDPQNKKSVRWDVELHVGR
jgi:SAM-dependent methyltransferase